MKFATNQIGQLTEATTLSTGYARRENQYYCPECQQEVNVALSGLGNNHFRHKPGHQICFYSSSSGQKRSKKQDWAEFLEVRERLTNLFEQEKERITKKSSLQWETASTIILILPFYLPEKQLLMRHTKAHTANKQLILLIPQLITDQQYENLSRYRNFRLRVRAIHKYAQQYCAVGLILTDGEMFIRLDNPQPVWSKRIERYCKTVIDYDVRIVFPQVFMKAIVWTH